MSESESEKQDAQKDYYKEAVKLYYYNCILYNHVRNIINGVGKSYDRENDLKTKVLKYELLGGELAQLDDEEIMNQLEDRKKKSRRSAADIDRQFLFLQQLQKAYGTEASLTQHQKLKHGQNSGMDAYFRI